MFSFSIYYPGIAAHLPLWHIGKNIDETFPPKFTLLNILTTTTPCLLLASSLFSNSSIIFNYKIVGHCIEFQLPSRNILVKANMSSLNYFYIHLVTNSLINLSIQVHLVLVESLYTQNRGESANLIKVGFFFFFSVSFQL